jgi:hypothetical protein
MRLFAPMLTIFTILLAACGGTDPDPAAPTDELDIRYDDTTANLKARGTLLGEEVAIREAMELVAVREYGAPAVAGTEADPEPVPDVALARLVSVEVTGTVMRNGAPWEVKLDIESEDLSSFAIGTLAPGSVAIEFQLENEASMIELEDVAMSGTVQILRYEDEGGLEENDDVRVGGKLGGMFDLQLSNGDRVEGAFFTTFEDPEIEVQ